MTEEIFISSTKLWVEVIIITFSISSSDSSTCAHSKQ